MAYKIVCLILFIAAASHSHPYGPHGSLSSPSKEKLVPIDWVGSYDGSLNGPGSRGGHDGSKDIVGGQKYLGGVNGGSSQGGYQGKDASKFIRGSGGSLDGLGRGQGSKDIIAGQSDRYIFGSTGGQGAYAGEGGTKEGIKEISYGNDALIGVDGGGKDVVYGRGDIAGYNSGSQGGRLDGAKRKVPGQGALGEYAFIPITKPGGYGNQDGQGFDKAVGNQGGYGGHGSRGQVSGQHIGSQDGLVGGYGGSPHTIRGSGNQDEFDGLGGHREFPGGYGGGQGGSDGGNYGGIGGQREFDGHRSAGYGSHGHKGSENGGSRSHGGYGGHSHGY